MNFYKMFLISMLFLVSIGGVCATDTDNITDFDNNCLSDVNCSNTLTNNLNSNDVIYNDSNIDCCGAIAFQSVLKENGINITLKEANKAIHSVNGTTSMQGLIDGARKYNLTAMPLKFNNSNLKTGLIVHMNIDGKDHWIPIENFTNHILVIKILNDEADKQLESNINITIFKQSEADKQAKATNKKLKTNDPKLKKAKTKVFAPKVRNFYKSKKYFKVTVKNSLTGKPISNLKLKLTVYTGKKHENYYVKTNSKGVAKLSTKYLKIGPHKVLINSANSKYSVKSKSSIIIKKKVIKSIMTKIKLIKPNSWNIPYKKIGGNDCIYSTYDPHFSPQDECSRGTHIDLCGVDSMEPYSHLLVKAKIYFKNKKGKIITKTCKSDGYGILKIAPKGYIPYKAKVYYYHT